MRLLPLLLLLVGLSVKAQPLPEIVIIIDDIGNNLRLGERAAKLPGPVNLALLPHTPNSQPLADLAHSRGHGIMLHAPMSNLAHKALGPGGLTEQMSEQEFIGTLRSAIGSIPHIEGINNHMGSRLTQMPLQMGWVMNELKRQDLFFIDSRTTHLTVAANMARATGLANAERDIFLDHHRDTAAVSGAFEELLQVAKENGRAIGIGHPYPETLQVLEQRLPALLLRGFKLVRASKMVHRAPSCQQLSDNIGCLAQLTFPKHIN